MSKKYYLVISTLFVMFHLSVMSGHAATITVTNKSNSGAGSLRQAILDATPGETIDFAPNVNGSIQLASPLLLDKNLTINGPGANILGVEGRNTPTESRVFNVFTSTVRISDLRISRGFSSGAGGGVTVESGGNLTLNNCLISGNSAESAGGVFGGSGAIITITNSTITGNISAVEGGGVSNRGGTLMMTNTLIIGNEAPLGGGVAVDAGGTATILNTTIAANGNAGGLSGEIGGLWINGASTVNLKNTIVAKNIVLGTSITDVGGTVISQGNNLIGNTTGGTGFIASDLQNDDPQFGGFANNGGPTYTLSLLAASPAINAGNNTGAPATDQRGVARPQGGTVDIGSFESGVTYATFGKIVFVAIVGVNREIFSMNPNGSNQLQLTSNSARDDSPKWSRDGSRIVFVSDRDGLLEIYTMNADGSGQTRMTNNSVLDENPVWSPDGTKIAFDRSGEIFVMNATPLAVASQLTSSSFLGVKAHPSWSPDGTQIVFHNNRGFGDFRVQVIASSCISCTGGQTLVNDLSPDNFDPVWSPDGNTIAFSNDQFDLSDHSQPETFFLSPFLDNLNFPSRPLNAVINPRIFSPAWSPDGSKLVYRVNAGGLSTINADGSNPTLLGVSGSLPDWFGCNTPTGANITVVYGTVSVTFSNVTSPCGTTIAVPIDPTTAGTLPANFSLGAGFPAYEITTTASFTGPVTTCIAVPAATDFNTFSRLRILHGEPGLVNRTTSSNFATKTICAVTNSLSPFVVALDANAPTAAPAVISGTVTTPDSAPLGGVVMTLTGSAGVRRTITDDQGFYQFADAETGGFYIVSPLRANYSFAPAERSFSLLADRTDAVFTATLVGGGFDNPLDTPEYFVRQHYLDFLGREPDESGFNFWSDQILSCGSDAACIERRTINVSAAYFLSIEFQQTGGLVNGLYRVGYGVRPQFAEFMPDTRAVAQDVVVGRDGWQAKLEANKQAFVTAFVNRPAFRTAFDSLSNEDYVATLISHTGVTFTSGERDALVSGLLRGTMTRADVLRSLADNQRFVNAKFNETFVMMEYFGYLRRDPDESGYAFWLNKLNEFNGNFEHAEMVKAFLVSAEYRDRFTR